MVQPTSRIGRIVLLLLGSVAACSGAAPGDAPQPPKPDARFALGVNVSNASYFSGEPLFANLLTGAEWRDSGTGWEADAAKVVDARGNLTLAPGQKAVRLLMAPASVISGRGTTVRCTWEGKGYAWVNGIKSKDVARKNGWEFYWPGTAGMSDKNVWLEVLSSNAADPIRNFDCREKDVPRSELFSAEFLESLKPYAVLRFLEWSQVNGNPKVTWATRTRPDSIDQGVSRYGVAFEHMIALANRMDADPWFNIPWNADEEYVRNMAQLVHDGVAADRHVYVELSNEVWNFAFPVANQAKEEGLAEGLATDPYKAALLRYAEKTRWAMNIWAAVFKDSPGQLVRVGATQADSPWGAGVQMDEGKMAEGIDALAIAPYFGGDLIGQLPPDADAATAMPILAKMADQVMTDRVAQHAAIARRHGKRLIAYEAGQHVVGQNTALVAAINRSPLMYDIYRRYIENWKTRVGDVMVLFNSSGTISGWGAWGLREYAGQPLDQTPKRRAAIAFGRDAAAPATSPPSP